ncbi:prephenate dehydrogenase/arogenate dehydrogenase family protein [Egibacter rhizosphaerae]|uniref:Prephenate dehydrogenase n=1 Tax=Egibacter rhizosphaerae TaxID=1670831 RepID=A0A411YK54_9ACTN|nr:prephenate dehydrogenase/arogenate dehydrogenase family protein [Egibacter rhizosphaerae]QBI21594.1 prephenate dehydrogenase/arogenate dehydrogenase family protein [Egibacter rhizosphaerae]
MSVDTPPPSDHAARLPRRVALVGTGLIGTSLGLALRRVSQIERVTGYDADAQRLAVAHERGALDAAASTAEEAARGADLVVLAVPASAVGRAAASVASALPEGAILTDVASVKRRVVEQLQDAAPAGVHVIGGHPMAGSHESGPEHGSAELFVGATYLLTPTTYTAPAAYQRLHALAGAIGARPLAVHPARHDLLVAVVSHLPQLAATTLMNLATERAQREHAGLLLLAAGGFRDATRVAASDPDLWLEICAENREAITAVLDDYAERIRELRESLAHEDSTALRQVLEQAHAGRRGLPSKEVSRRPMVELVVPIADRPGTLSEVTTTVGAVGVNIEDMGIEHAAEGGRGALRLAVSGTEEAHRARDAITARGYEVVERRL